jgi:hypothetical protein
MRKLILGALSIATSTLANIIDCGGLFKITELYQSPDSYVSVGQNVSLTLKYNVPIADFTGGTAINSITINGIPIGSSTDDLCTKLDCPIISGPHDGSSWAIFPSSVSGKIVSKVIWKDSLNNQLLCVQSTLKTEAKKTYLRRAPALYLDLMPMYDIEGSSSGYDNFTTQSEYITINYPNKTNKILIK